MTCSQNYCEHGANARAHEDRAVRLCIVHRNNEIMRVLLENGADVYCSNKYVLNHLQIFFDEKMADAVLPYCDARDYEYFPDEYIKRCVVPTKSARIKN